jgi:hypothetical protein
MITLSISVAEADEHSSRGGTPLPGTAEESRIKTLKIFVFRSDDNTLEQYKGVLINDNNTSDDPSWNAATKSLRVVITPGNKRVYCVANWAATPDAEMPELSDQTIADTATLLAVTRAHGGVTPRNPPVMSGRMTRNITGAEQELGITIERQVAMVNIYPMLSPLLGALDANVTIEGVKFTRLAGASYLFPRVPAVNPAGVAWDQSAFEGVSSARVTATTPAAAVKYPVTYYIPENIAADENAATRVTVKAIYNGATVYYSLPLRGEGVPSPHAVERNHAYNYYLTIQGVGAATVALAPRRSL